MKISDKLKSLIRDRDPLFVAVGNVFKNDDGVGVFIGKELEKAGKNALVVEMSVEKYVGKINRIPHDLLVIIDAISFNKDPGYADIIPVSEILDQTSNTHNLSLSHVAEFFEKPVFILGIQPENVRIGENITLAVKKSACKIIDILK